MVGDCAPGSGGPSINRGCVMASATNASVSASAAGLRPAYQAYQILHVGYVVLPLIAGSDKFFDRLVNWDASLAPVVTRVTGLAGHTFMMIVGVIEVVAGLLVAF